MATRKDIPYLVQLLEDKSPAVRDGVLRGFLDIGPDLETELAAMPTPLDPESRRMLDRLLGEYFCSRICEAWPAWLSLSSDNEKLEKGYALLAEFQDGLSGDGRVGTGLDDLAAAYLAGRDDPPTPASLMQFLFFAQKFRGATQDYHHPRNSNLAYVLESRRGIPISLACMAILVADRVGVQIHGCNFPGHFLARFGEGSDAVYVDCFNGGRIYRESELSSRFADEVASPDAHTLMPASTEAIFARVLRNLVYAYSNTGDQRRLSATRKLLLELERIPVSQSKPLFEPGQLIRHKHHTYHGVITAVDSVCRASDGWYWSNRSQPDRNQPWYHVLVDGSDACTYAAQENLESDVEGLPIQHPLLERFFTGFQQGRYIRNDRPWLSE